MLFLQKQRKQIGADDSLYQMDFKPDTNYRSSVQDFNTVQNFDNISCIDIEQQLLDDLSQNERMSQKRGGNMHNHSQQHGGNMHNHSQQHVNMHNQSQLRGSHYNPIGNLNHSINDHDNHGHQAPNPLKASMHQQHQKIFDGKQPMFHSQYQEHNRNFFYSKNLDGNNFSKGHQPHRVESNKGHVVQQEYHQPHNTMQNHEREEFQKKQEEYLRKQLDQQREIKNLQTKNQSLQREIDFIQSQKDDLLNDQSMIRDNTENVMRQQITDANHKVLMYKKDKLDADLKSKELEDKYLRSLRDIDELKSTLHTRDNELENEQEKYDVLEKSKNYYMNR